MAAHQSRELSHLLNLPADIHKLIVECLSRSTFKLCPRYSDDESGWEEGACPGNLKAKHKEYYGEITADDDACINGLRNWSQTCRYFQSLIAPELCKTVVLRSTPASVRSIKALSRTKYWSQVQNFIFASTWESVDDDDAEEWEGETEEEIEDNMSNSKQKKISSEMVALAKILSKLPPNLKSLTLDFPQEWDLDFADEVLRDDQLHGTETDNRFLELEKCDRYRSLLRMSFEAVAKNDISQRAEFELKLFNVPPLRCSALAKQHMAPLLKHVTSFTFGACHYDNGAGWNMNTMDVTYFFGEKLGLWYFDHLDAVKTFSFYADKSWPFGSPEWYSINLSLPAASDRMSKVERISIKQVFVCTELVNFLVSHAATLVSLEMNDCYGAVDSLNDDGSQTDDEVPTWATLFTALAEAKPRNLVSFKIDYYDKTVQDILEYDKEDPQGVVARAKEILQRQTDVAFKAYEGGGRRADFERRKGKLLPYCDIDTKYGIVMECEEQTFARICNGADRDAWLELVDVIEENTGRKSNVVITNDSN